MKCVQMIMDVGMHLGEDTQFYLDKGFRVVAIEAHPKFVIDNRAKFEDYIEKELLEIVPSAITEKDGTVPFHVFPEKGDWGTLDPGYAQRNIARGTACKIVEVPSVTFESILQRYGVPYYLKIDIEGADILCIKALHRFGQRPKYVSFEAELVGFESTFEALSHLYVLGYRRFKIVNQIMNWQRRCPNPPREGKYVDARFTNMMSGPFGEEAPGTWQSIEPIVEKYRLILKTQRLFCPEGRYPRLQPMFDRVSGLFGGEPLGWYDIHATFPA
jgi:FkbM family methyltransferase